MKTNPPTYELPLGSFRQTLALFLFKKLHLVYTSIRKTYLPFWPKVNSWKMYCQADLKHYPFYTLGGALFQYLENNQFELIEGFEDHDVFHVLFDYPTHMLGEVQLQFFLLGMGKRSLPTWFTIIISFGLFPEWWFHMNDAYQKGKTATNCSDWQFEYLLNEPLEGLRNQIFQKPFSNNLII